MKPFEHFLDELSRIQSELNIILKQAPFYLNLIDFGDPDVMDFNEHLENTFTALELVKDEKYKVHVKRIKEDLNSFIEDTMIPCLLKLEIHIIFR